MKYIKSRYVKIFKTNSDNYVFYHTFNMMILVGTSEDADILRAYSKVKELDDSDVSKSFKEADMIINETFDEREYYVIEKTNRMIEDQKKQKNRIGYARISLTENCNLSCKYCFVNKVIGQKKNMSDHLIINIMNWIIEHNEGKSVLVQYFGGEPLLRMDLIDIGNKMLIEAKTAKKIIDYTQEIVTNGTLINNEIAKYFVENKILVSVSLDGVKEVNDKNRVTFEGHGTFDSAIGGLQIYVNYGGKPSIFITPNKDNINNFFETVNYFIERLNVKEITVNAPQPYSQGWEVDGEDFAKAVIELIKVCEEKKIIYNTPANNILYLLKEKRTQLFSCLNISVNQNENVWGVYITSGGKLSKCIVECNEKCTNNFDDFVMDSKFIDWHYRREMDKRCELCVGASVCGGACTIEHIIMKNKFNVDRCKFVSKIMEWILMESCTYE